jgi:DNA-binding response OmpR family regulator
VTRVGADAIWMAPAHDYDALVLDVMLPDVDGFEVCHRLRGAGVWSPVLILTARDSVEDRVEGLDSGADDCLVNPFAFAELLARLRALTRRGDAERPAVLAVGDLRLDPAIREVRRGATAVSLSAKESHCWRRSCAGPAKCSRACTYSNTPGTCLREPLQHRCRRGSRSGQRLPATRALR